MTNGPQSLDSYMSTVGRAARQAANSIRLSKLEIRCKAIENIAKSVEQSTDDILLANQKDMEAGSAKTLSPAMLDRLRLDVPRIDTIVRSVRSIAAQTDPIGAILDEWSRPNGLTLRKVAVPIGVIGMIYESRPNVTVDAASLCILSGNSVVLRGGSEAVHTNHALHRCIVQGLETSSLPAQSVQLLTTQDRDAVGLMLEGLDGDIDLIIPRGGKGLVARVQQDARIPVLAHLDGLNHTYIHQSADIRMALDIIINAKMRRTGICGATETVLIDKAIAPALLPGLTEQLTAKGCELRGDQASQALVGQIDAATSADFDTEHLAPILNVAIVQDIDAALTHIARHGSGHTDAIIAADTHAAQRFLTEVDSAIVMHNASTQFADGGEFGFGAEIGIATGRLHARGPVGAQHLTTYKYQVIGTGTVRS